MDPQTLNNLDPKLRETYERVMGAAPAASEPNTASTEPQNSADNLSATPNPTPTHEETPSQTPDNTQLSDTPTAAPQTNHTETEPPTQTVTISQPLPEASLNIPSSSHSALLKVFYILGSTVFFLVYAFFWMRIFGLQIPGLSF